ncbi:MAG: hypothetical protein RLZZ461_468 [Planctomycetota bacterium]
MRRTLMLMNLDRILSGRLVWSVAVLLIVSSTARSMQDDGVAEASPPIAPSIGWPRSITRDGGTIVLQAPQIDRWTDDTLTATFAAAVGFGSEADSSTGTVGAITITARVFQNTQTQEATLYNLALESASFGIGGTADRAAAFARTIVPSNPVSMPIDRLLALVTEDTIVDVPVSGVSPDPPLVIYRTEPTTLLQVPDQIRLRPYAPGVETVVGVPQPLFRVTEGDAATWYLFDGGGWLSSPDLMAESWSDVTVLPGPLADLPDEPRYAAFREAIATIAEPHDVVPKVAHANRAAELVVVDGDPDWRAVPGTNLLQLQDSTSDVFLNTTDQRYYLLASGRWFTVSAPDAEWSRVQTGDLPSEFRDIPATDPDAGPVLASVPGTIESRQAIVRAQIPEVAAIKKNAATLDVIYDGSPKFERIERTSMQYAVNADVPVIRVSGRCFAVKDAVWFTSSKPTGPWAVAVAVPDEIYTIPSDHPLYPVTFVRIIGEDETVVIVGCTSGYENVYVDDGGCVVYGTGYWWPSWYWSSWYWTPWYWYHPPCWGWAHWYDPATGRYVAARGWVGPKSAGAAYRWANPDTGWRGAGYVAASPYAAWGRTVATNGDAWVAARGAATSTGAVGQVRTSEGTRVVAGTTGDGWKATGVHDGNRYVAGNGNVYRRDDGSWQKYEDGQWVPVDRSPATRESFDRVRPALERQATARDRANTSGWSSPSTWNRDVSRPAVRPTTPTRRPVTPSRRPSFGGGRGGGFRGR